MNIFSHLKDFFRSLAHPYPARDWFMTLIATFFIFFAFASYGVYLYFEMESGAIFQSANTAAAQPIQVTHSDIANVLDAYRVRSANWSAHNIPVPPERDPR